MLDVVATRDEHALIAHLGPDLLADDFPTRGLPESLRRLAAHGEVPLAEVLLDQRVVAGIGTIYMAEALFARRLWPWVLAGQVTDQASVLMTARELMVRSVAAHSPTATGEVGRNRTTRVHGRAGRACLRCATPVAVGQARRPPMERPVFYCPTCQVVGRPVSRPG
jgi:endonuclease-8